MGKTGQAKRSHQSGKKAAVAVADIAVVLDVAKKSLVNAPSGASPAEAFVTSCLLKAIITQPSSKPVAFIGLAGQIDLPAKRFPAAVRPVVESQIVAMVDQAMGAPGAKESSARGSGYTIQLRVFADSATAETWARTHAPSDQQRIRLAVPQESQDKINQIRRAVRAIADALPDAYAKKRDGIVATGDAVREELARALEPILNAEAAKLPQATYDEKKTLAKWINAELRRVGLAIRCPKTGNPCLIVATTGHSPLVGRFVLDYTDSEGKRQHPVSSVTLPTLQLMPDDLTRAPYGERRSRSR